MRKTIKIKCQNGIKLEDAIKDIFFELGGIFHFVEADDPDFILFGPYGNDIPPPGKYIRIGYFCENIIPDLTICDYAFGVPTTAEVNSPKYKRIQWHGLEPNSLIKNLTDNDIDFMVGQKNRFCNFIYSNPVPYREEFFKQLSKYKKVDAPGKSMNNMESIDSQYEGSFWERKRQFLTTYKFSIAFENYAYPGYQTEKLYDAMQVNSIPIYCGDINIGEIFNTKSFLNAFDYIDAKRNKILTVLEKASQQDFIDYRPTFNHQLHQQIIRRLKLLGRRLKMNVQFNKLDFSPLIDRIIAIDRDPDLYAKYLREPWFNENRAPENASLKQSWIDIFNQISAF